LILEGQLCQPFPIREDNMPVTEHHIASGGGLGGNGTAEVFGTEPVIRIQEGDAVEALIHGRQSTERPWCVAVVVMTDTKADVAAIPVIEFRVSNTICHQEVGGSQFLTSNRLMTPS
jgi:hypothetical protein